MNETNPFDRKSTLVAVGLILLLVATARAGEGVAKEIEESLIAPCCWRQPVAEHLSPAADQMRREIGSMLAEGLSKEEIVQFYVKQYGQVVLAKPPYVGSGILAYALPGIVLMLSAAFILRYVRSGATPEEMPPPDLEDRDLSRLNEELRAFDSA